MCRFAAYSGPARPLSDLALDAPQALQKQSLAASEGKTPTNGDGFGLGWYDSGGTGYVFRDTNPAWADENFEAIARSVIAPLYFIHCRAATGTETARSNCHPFKRGAYLFMHNGQIGGYASLRRPIEAMIADEFYADRRGTSDSEAIFLAMLSRVEAMGIVEALGSVLLDIHSLQKVRGITAPIRLCAALADGDRLWIFRWASDSRPPSLYLRNTEEAVSVASEPVNRCDSGWAMVPPNSFMLIRKGRIVETGAFSPGVGSEAPASPRQERELTATSSI